MHCRQARGRRFWALTAWMTACLASVACAPSGKYIWVENYKQPRDTSATEYRIAPGDIINVRVFNQEAMSARTRVRQDGKVSLPFLNDVAAAGQTPAEFAKTVEKRLLTLMREPVVTVLVDETHTSQVSVVGEVAKPGIYAIEPGQGVLRALAAAGGLNDYAHKDRIFVLRSSEAARIRFRMDELAMPGTPAARFRLLADDAIIVE
jgi:polysaccharide export outer membrane protein